MIRLPWGRRHRRFTIAVDALVNSAIRLDELGASAFIGWEPSPETYDAIAKEFSKLEEAVVQLRSLGYLPNGAPGRPRLAARTSS